MGKQYSYNGTGILSSGYGVLMLDGKLLGDAIACDLGERQFSAKVKIIIEDCTKPMAKQEVESDADGI